MSAQLQQPSTAPDLQAPSGAQATSHTRNRTVGGIVLVVVGLLLLAGQLTDWSVLGWLIFPVMAIIFLAWGLATRSFGLVIPGGIFAGLGLGMFTMIGPLSTATAALQPGLFLICFAAGWGLISLLSLVTSDRWAWWPLIPGAAIGLVGMALLGGNFGLSVLKLSGYVWPLILVALGAYLLLVRRK
jgi:hypothetical protein